LSISTVSEIGGGEHVANSPREASSSPLVQKLQKIVKKILANLKKLLNSNHSPKKGNWWSVEPFFLKKKKKEIESPLSQTLQTRGSTASTDPIVKWWDIEGRYHFD